MKSKITNYATLIMGLLLLAVSLYLIKTSNDPQGIMRTLPYVCIGIGCGLFGHGMGNVISERAINSYPELKRQLDIEKNDERNVAIANRAKGKAFDMMTFCFWGFNVIICPYGDRYGCCTSTCFCIPSCSRLCPLLSL